MLKVKIKGKNWRCWWWSDTAARLGKIETISRKKRKEDSGRLQEVKQKATKRNRRYRENRSDEQRERDSKHGLKRQQDYLERRAEKKPNAMLRRIRKWLGATMTKWKITGLCRNENNGHRWPAIRSEGFKKRTTNTGGDCGNHRSDQIANNRRIYQHQLARHQLHAGKPSAGPNATCLLTQQGMQA